jgi:prepilin-type N-terminal cleavage/methylation domain-containing protein
MKRLRGKRAFTLIEVILAIAIFAAIALPLFSVFAQSIKVDMKSNDVMNANYIAQDYIEKLNALTYLQALQNKPSKAVKGDYTLSADITPYGAVSSLLGGPCGYVHLITRADGKMLAVMPDGKWYLYSSAPSSISLSLSGANYTFTTNGSKTMTGSVGFSCCAMLINAISKPATATVTLGANCKAVYYCQQEHESDTTIKGAHETYNSSTAGDTSLIYVKASVYDGLGEEVASSVSYLDIKNG